MHCICCSIETFNLKRTKFHSQICYICSVLVLINDFRSRKQIYSKYQSQLDAPLVRLLKHETIFILFQLFASKFENETAKNFMWRMSKSDAFLHPLSGLCLWVCSTETRSHMSLRLPRIRLKIGQPRVTYEEPLIAPPVHLISAIWCRQSSIKSKLVFTPRLKLYYQQ